MPDPFAQALHDYHFDELREPLIQRCGEETREPDVGGYFSVVGDDDEGPDGTDDGSEAEEDWLDARLDGPLLDMGAGAGRHALYYQDRFETVAIERSEALVEVLDDRGVEDAREADMFALREAFGRDRFRSAIAFGTQVGLAGSVAGLRAFLADLAHVTAPDATAVFDGFDPDHADTRELLDYRPDPAPGLAYRIAQFEYDGTLGEPWLYRLFSPDRIREAVAGTRWRVADVRYGDGDWAHTYHVALEKR